jgi:Protein of unknown function (DUF3168)
MTIEEALLDRIASLSAVVATVGGRVYLLLAPQSPTYPYVLVQGVSDVSSLHARGPVALKSARVQVDTVAHVNAGDPYATAARLLEAIKGDGKGPQASGLDGWIGVIGTIDVHECAAAGRTPGRYDPGEIQAVRISQDFDVWYREAAA